MIHIIGTRHSLQFWTNAKRNGKSLDATKEDVEKFENYLADAAQSLKANMIAEEASDKGVADYGDGACSVAKSVATKLRMQHLFCDPDVEQRRELGLKVGEELVVHSQAVSRETGQDWEVIRHAEIKSQFPIREAFWSAQLQRYEPNKRTIIFVCGACHAKTLKAKLDSEKILASIHCGDWTP